MNTLAAVLDDLELVLDTDNVDVLSEANTQLHAMLERVRQRLFQLENVNGDTDYDGNM